MKVMFVNGSSHLRGTTMAAIEEMEKVFRAEGIETEVIQVGGKPIADCLQCNVCGKTGKCVFTDDGVNEFVEKAKDADGFVFATPVLHTRADGFSISWIAHFTAATATKTSNSSPAQQSQSQEEAGRRLRWTR